MNQFLLVSGEDPVQIDRLFASGKARFRLHFGTEPVDELHAGPLRMAVFPLYRRPGAPISRRAETGTWGAGCGTLFFQGKTGREAVDRILLAGDTAASALQAASEQWDGLFTLACGDPGGEFFIATDRLGNLHVYETRLNGCTAVSTSSMVLAGLGPHAPDWSGCRQFLSTGTVFGSRTLFDGIEKLAPARIYRFSAGRRAGDSLYWDIKSKFHGRALEPGGVEPLAAALVETMDGLAAACPNPLLDLTGGYDSRCVLAAMLETGRKFTAIVGGAGDSPDVLTAKRIAREFGLNLIHRPPAAQDAAQAWTLSEECFAATDGEYDVLLYGDTFQTHLRSAAEFDVSVNGSNGEITKGYWYELLFPHTGSRGHFDSRRVAAARFTYAGEPEGLLAHDFESSVTAELAALIDEANLSMREYPNTALMDNAYLTLRMQRWQGRISSSTQRIWPGASPFMFRRPMELALATPGPAKARLRFTTRLIEKLNPRLAALPLEFGYPALPLRPGNFHRFVVPGIREYAPKILKKMGISSGSKPALGAPASDLTLRILELPGVRSVLDPDGMASGGLYRPRRLHEWLKDIESPDSSERKRLGRVLTLELLARAVRC